MDCPFEEILFSKHDCRVATDTLGLTFNDTSNFNETRRPAGCFYQNEMSFFNPTVDPSITNPVQFVDTQLNMGGVCRQEGKFHIPNL